MVSTIVNVSFNLFIFYRTGNLCTNASRISVAIQVILIALVAAICDISARKVGQIKTGLRPDPRKESSTISNEKMDEWINK